MIASAPSARIPIFSAWERVSRVRAPQQTMAVAVASVARLLFMQKGLSDLRSEREAQVRRQSSESEGSIAAET